MDCSVLIFVASGVVLFITIMLFYVITERFNALERRVENNEWVRDKQADNWVALHRFLHIRKIRGTNRYGRMRDRSKEKKGSLN